MNLWKKFTELTITKKLKLSSGAVMDVNGTEVDLTELAALNSIGAADLAKIDGITNGTQAAGKAVVADANVNTGVSKVTELHIGASGSETQVTATATEINMAADHSANVETVAATNVITAAESGKTFFLNHATEFVSTLPAAAAGLRFSFIVSGAPSGASYTIVTDSSANIIKGQVYTVDVNSATDPDFETSGGDTITLVDSKAVAGDRVDVICDGTNWFAYGFCSVFDAITITTAS